MIDKESTVSIFIRYISNYYVDLMSFLSSLTVIIIKNY